MKKMMVMVVFAILASAVPASAQNKGENTYLVIVDYDKTLYEKISAGKYNYPTKFPNFVPAGNGKQKVIIELVCFGQNMKTDSVLQDLEAKGLRPATVDEICAFGATYPGKQKQFPIIALGSIWRDSDGNRRVPCLDSTWWFKGRDLRMVLSDVIWLKRCRFAAVRQ